MDDLLVHEVDQAISVESAEAQSEMSMILRMFRHQMSGIILGILWPTKCLSITKLDVIIVCILLHESFLAHLSMFLPMSCYLLLTNSPESFALGYGEE